MAETAERMHQVYEDDDECIEDCSGCHWEGNLDCEALPWGCDICDPDDQLSAVAAARLAVPSPDGSQP